MLLQEYEALQSKPVAQLTSQDRQRLDDLQEQLQTAQQQLQAAQQQAQQAQQAAAEAQRKAELVATANVSTGMPSAVCSYWGGGRGPPSWLSGYW